MGKAKHLTHNAYETAIGTQVFVELTCEFFSLADDLHLHGKARVLSSNSLNVEEVLTILACSMSLVRMVAAVGQRKSGFLRRRDGLTIPFM